MARRKGNTNVQDGRVTTANAIRPNTYRMLRPMDFSPIKPRHDLYRAAVLETGDRRRYHPNKFLQTPAAIRRDAVRLVQPLWSEPRSVSFAVPKKVALCVRRKVRKEVMFAKGHGGMKVSRQKPRKNNYWSRISC